MRVGQRATDRYARFMADEDQNHPALSPAERIAMLQRIAFGRADSPAEHERANEALRQLQQLSAAGVRDASLAEPATDADRDGRRHASDGPGAGANVGGAIGSVVDQESDRDNDVEPDAASTPRGAALLSLPLSALPRWVLPTMAVGLIAVGGIVGFIISGTSGASSSALPSGDPSSSVAGSVDSEAGYVDVAESPPPLNTGDITAAERWFGSEQSAEDALPMPIEMIDPTSSRLVFQAPGEDAWSAWVGRNSREDGFCIAIYHPESGMAESTCATTANFISSGLSIATSSGVNLNWNGAVLTATRAR